MSIEHEIKTRLENNLDLLHFELKDFTGRHLNHELHEGGFHLEAIIVSNSFEGLTLINRHKKVYEAMGELMKHEIHALSMKTHTKSEWDKM
ncbi:MAG: BolA family transcriptional regulator [Candidatus Marinimicrobia bacterium]|nr:BolA family transcriptional regulator [Candidatus Neomarinimicrobiota bacterium]|tara:strand:- start:550 stop:822 length:273 start_codon:yes stop_codon:yes gene_type:complete